MICRVLAEFDGVNAGYNSGLDVRIHDVDPTTCLHDEFNA